jgi:hypothetical protein
MTGNWIEPRLGLSVFCFLNEGWPPPELSYWSMTEARIKIHGEPLEQLTDHLSVVVRVFSTAFFAKCGRRHSCKTVPDDVERSTWSSRKKELETRQKLDRDWTGIAAEQVHRKSHHPESLGYNVTLLRESGTAGEPAIRWQDGAAERRERKDPRAPTARHSVGHAQKGRIANVGCRGLALLANRLRHIRGSPASAIQ